MGIGSGGPSRTGTLAAQNDSVDNTELGADISNLGPVIELDTQGRSALDIGLDGTAAATYQLEASPDSGTWFGPYEEWPDVTEINDGMFLGFRYVRLVVTSSAAAGDEADISIAASR